MRKIIVGEFISLDGVVEAPETWHFPYLNEQMMAAIWALSARADTMLLGRVTFQSFAGAFGQAPADDPVASQMNKPLKVVVSATLTELGWKNSTLLPPGDVAAQVARLKAEPGGDILVTGSTTLVRTLLRAGLVDELSLLVHPILVGTGGRLFEDGDPRVPLTLVESTVFSTGVVNQVYADRLTSRRAVPFARKAAGRPSTAFVHVCEDAGMRAEAAILHADLDAFYASVEQRDHPWLRGRPVIVGGGVVLAASYEAKRRGVRTAMGGREARALCPDAVVMPPRMSAYSAASKAVFEVFRDTTPLVEGVSIDEAFLDVSGLHRISGTPTEIAIRLRREVLRRVGLPITVGAARTKFLAKVASRVAKPDGLLVVEPDGELAFLHPLPVQLLWGVGPVTAGKLHERGIRTVGQVARVGEPALVSMLGPGAGRHLHALAHNQDPRPVHVGKRRGSIGSQRALGRGPHRPEEIDATLAGLVDRVTRRMRAAGRPGRTVVLRLRFADFSRATRSRTLLRATVQTQTILDTARGLLVAARPLIEQQGITLVGIAVGNLGDNRFLQQELPFDPRDTGELDAALDAVRDRYGSASLTRAVLLGRDPGLTVPMLPD